MQQSDFEALTNPLSVAVVGATTPERSWFGGRAFRNLAAGSAERRLYAVNPRLAGEHLLGRSVFPDVASLPETPDLTVVLTPAATVPAVLEDVGRAGGRRVLLCTASRDADAKDGFAEEIRALANRFGLCLIGGNSMGIISPPHDLAATFSSASDRGIPAGTTAYISQSGAAITYLVAALRGSPIGYSHLISTGDEIVVQLPEILERVVDDDRTESIVLFLEGTAAGAKLRHVLTKAQAIGKPVVVLKVGRTAAGREAAQSHTGRMTGDDDVYRALFAETGVAVAESYEQLHDIARRIGMVGRRVAAGRRAAVVTTSGGTGVVAADGLVDRGWVLPAPSDATSERLAAAGAQPPANPLDATGSFQVTDRLATMIGLLGRSGEYDELLLLTGAGGDSARDIAAHLAATAEDLATPVTCAWIAPSDPTVIATLERAGIPVYPDPTRAVRSVHAHVTANGDPEARQRAKALLELLDAEPAVSVTSTRPLTAAQLFTELTNANVPCAPWAAVDPEGTDDDLLAAVRGIGYPVVLKIDSTRQLHKTELGGVVSRIESDEQLLAARDRLRLVVEAADPDAQLMLQKMLTGVEVLVGARHDPSFGPVLAIGLGGVLAELFADVQPVLLPALPEELDRVLDGHARLAALLAGYRAGPAADVDSLRHAVHALARWVAGPGAAYAEVDCNPVIATPEGAFVVDVRAIVAHDSGDDT